MAYNGDGMYLVLYREHGDEEPVWKEDSRSTQDIKTAALKQYAMRVKDHGKENVLIVKCVNITCISVDVLCDGETVNSQ